MKIFIILSVLFASALSARLDNTYIPPPPNAYSAGGQNLEAPKQAYASNIQNSYSAPQQQSQYQHQRQSHNNGGASQQGTYTSHQSAPGYQSVSAGSYSGQNYQAPQQQQSYSQPQTNYRQQQQPSNQNSYQQQGYQQQGSGYDQASTTPIPIIKYENEPHRGDGKYRFEYLTGNGIMAQEEGYLNNPNAQYPDYPEQVAIGSYSYTAPDGQLISLSYKADANGFQPEGDHLPQPVTHTPEFYAEVEKQKQVAAEIEAEGQRILALQAELAKQQPQQQQQNNQYYQQNQGASYNQQSSSDSYNYQPQPSNNVYRQPQQQQQQQPQKHSGYNQNAQPVRQQQNPQQQYLPPHNKSFGKK